MALNIISNFAANVAHRNLTVNDRRATGEIARLSSGLRVLGARDDAASLAIGSRLRAEVGALRQANVNAGQASSLLQVADGALNTISDILFRLKTLAVQSGSDTLGEAERNSLQLEFNSLQREIDRIAGDTEFNGVQLINGETRVITRVGDETVAQAGAGLRLIDNTIGLQQGITDVKFSDGFDSTLVEIAYAVDGQNGIFTVTDLSQPVGSSAVRTATGLTALPLTPGVETDLNPGQTETIDVVFDRGGVNERTVSITIDSAFSKTTFNPTRLENTASLTGEGGFAPADVFTVRNYGGNLAGLSTQIVADATSAITASRLRIANSGGEELVAVNTPTTPDTVDFTNTDAQNIRFQNSQGDFVDVTINLSAALTDAEYAQLQDVTDSGTLLELLGLNGQGNDLVTGSLAVRATSIATPGTIASLINSGDVSVREIGGTGSNTPLSLSYTASTNSFTGTIGNTTGQASNALSGINGEAGRTVVTVGTRIFEVTVSGAFNRNRDIADAASRITALPTGLAATFNDGNFSFRINSFTPGTGQTTESLLDTLRSTNFVINGDNDAQTANSQLTFSLGATYSSGDVANSIAANSSVTVDLEHANGNIINVTVTNNSANDLTSGGAAAADGTLDDGETLAFQANRLSNTAFLSSGGRTQASFDIIQVSGDLAGLDNRIRFERGATGNVLTEAIVSIDHSDARRGNLTGTADLTRIGFQAVTLRNSAGDTITLNLNLSTQVTETQLNRRDTSAETFVSLGELRQSVTFGSSFNDRRSFSFKVGSGILESDSVTFDVGAANLRSLGIERTGLDAVRIDGADTVNSDRASVAVTGAIDRLNNVRAIIGAGQNRLEFASNNVAVAVENAEAARSTLLDLDVAAGISAFTSSQILVQAGISILAQANQQPQQLLRLFE